MRFSFKKIEILIFVIFFGLFAVLGGWQVQRANEKKAIEQQINARSNAPALVLDGPVSWNADDVEYQHLRVSGTFLPRAQLLIDNILRGGKPGFHVMTPLQVSGTETVILVNRGWAAQGHTRQDLPQIKLPAGVQTLEGIVRTPSALPFVDASMTALKADAPFSLWLYADLNKYRKESGLDVLPFAMLQNNDNGDGLVRDWPPYRAKVAMHIGYAIQWFAFAIIVTVIFIGIGRKRGRKVL